MTLILDAGGLIAFERNDRRAILVIRRAVERGDKIVVPAGVVAQVWRDGSRQARIAGLLNAPEVNVVALDDALARAAGRLLGWRQTSDVIDATVVIVARAAHGVVLTSDEGDLRRLEPAVRTIGC